MLCRMIGVFKEMALMWLHSKWPTMNLIFLKPLSKTRGKPSGRVVSLSHKLLGNSLATLLFEATFDFCGNLIKLLATYGNHEVL